MSFLPLLVTASLLAAASTLTHAERKRIVHFSDVHLNLSTSFHPSDSAATIPLQFGWDSPLRLLESALEFASLEVLDPDVLLYTGDYVAHCDSLTSDHIRKTVEANLKIIEKYYPVGANEKPRYVTAITGNADSNMGYDMAVTEPEAPGENGANPSLLLVSAAWELSMAPTDYQFFTRRGYLVYDIDAKLSMITLNTVPYSPSHTPDTSSVVDPFNQFAWLNTTLRKLREASRVAFIAGHIPPIVDSNRTQPMWHEHYIRTYQSIIAGYRDVVKAQFFGHVHSIEFRIALDAMASRDNHPVPPLFTSGSLSPKYGNNPSFMVWEYDAETHEVHDYTVYATNDSDTAPLLWTQLFKAGDTYKLSSLSTASLADFRARMESNDLGILATYYWNMKARSFNLPPCDDVECRAKTLCTLTWWPTLESFADCVRSTQSRAAGFQLPLGHLLLGVVAILAAYALLCAVGFAARHHFRQIRGAPYTLVSAVTKKKRDSVAPLHDATHGASVKF